jgi:glutamate/aspartate transport system substrate-binding protein
MNRRWIRCVLGLFGACALQVQAQPRNVLEQVARQGMVVVGYSADAPPFSAVAAKGAPAGYSIDWCLQIVEHLKNHLQRPDLKVRFAEVPQDQMVRVVASAGVHLMCAAVSDTPERRQKLRFSEPIFFSSVRLMVRSDAGFSAATQLKGRNVAVIGRTSAEAAVAAFSRSQGLDMTLSRVVGADAALSQLVLRQSDAWARDEVLLLGTRAKQHRPSDFTVLPEGLTNEPIAIALPPDPGLQSVVDQAMVLAMRSGAADRMYEQWFVRPNAMVPSGLGLNRSAELTRAWLALR